MSQYLINTRKEIDATCRTLAGEAVIGVDTEFLRVRTYYPKLALVQLSSPDAVYCIDPLVPDMDLGELWALLSDPGILKVMHAARQDIEVLLHTAGVMPKPLYDTQIAAALVGYGDQVGYAGLVEAEFGESLPKTSQRTDWTRRPLSEAQLGYAANDVRFLLPLQERLTGRLKTLGRYGWALEDFERDLDPALYEPDPDQAYRRVGRGARLDTDAQHTLKRLCTWREHTARDRNLPRSWVLDDAAVAAIAAERPRSVDELQRIEEVRRDAVRRDGRAIIDCLRQPAEGEDRLWRRHEALSPEQKATSSALVTALKARAAELGISQSVLLTRADLDKLTREVPAREVISGWRWEVIGRELQQILDERTRHDARPNGDASAAGPPARD